MDIIELRDMLKQNEYSGISRGKIIELLAENDSRNANVIRALVLGKTERSIGSMYVIEKINFCIQNPDQPEAFLDFKRTQIFLALNRHY